MSDLLKVKYMACFRVKYSHHCVRYIFLKTSYYYNCSELNIMQILNGSKINQDKKEIHYWHFLDKNIKWYIFVFFHSYIHLYTYGILNLFCLQLQFLPQLLTSSFYSKNICLLEIKEQSLPSIWDNYFMKKMFMYIFLKQVKNYFKV